MADYTEAEFTMLIQAIKDCEGSEEWQNDLIAHLNSLAAGAGGSDLIFYPRTHEHTNKGAGLVFCLHESNKRKARPDALTLEKYNKRGKHLGEFDPITGQQTKPADKTREIEP